MPHLHAVNMSTKEDTESQLKLKMDISIYNHVESVAPPNRTDFSQMELWMEFKTKNDWVAFQDPSDPDSEELRRLAIKVLRIMTSIFRYSISDHDSRPRR